MRNRPWYGERGRKIRASYRGELVFDDACAVDDHVEAAVLRVDVIDQSAKGRCIAHIDGMVFHFGSSAAQILDALQDFAILEQTLQCSFHGSGFDGSG